MKRLSRFIAGLVLTAFVGLSAVETFHHHALAQTEPQCTLCTIAHQMPALTNTIVPRAPVLHSSPTVVLPSISPLFHCVFVSAGLSPPFIA